MRDDFDMSGSLYMRVVDAGSMVALFCCKYLLAREVCADATQGAAQDPHRGPGR